MKINRNYIIIGTFFIFVALFVFFTTNRKSNKTEFSNEIVYKNEDNLNISIKKVDNNYFEIIYKTDSFIDNSLIDEKIVVNYKNIDPVMLEDGKYFSFFKCNLNSADKKKYFILLDVSYSVVNKVGKDKFISDINHKLRKIFEKTKLNPGDEIEIRYLGDNDKEDLLFDFIGPVFKGDEKRNTVYKRNTLEIYDYGFTDDYYSCAGKKSLSNTQDLLKTINSGFIEKIKNPDSTSKISSTFKSIDSDLNKIGEPDFSKIVYILFSDAEDTENYSGCGMEDCGYKNINYTGKDEAYIIWSEKQYEENLKKIFKGTNLIIY